MKNIAVKGKVKAKACQYCKSHKNNPSRCKLKDEFIGRKKVCDDFKRK